MRRQFRSANPLHRRAIQRLRFAGKKPADKEFKPDGFFGIGVEDLFKQSDDGNFHAQLFANFPNKALLKGFIRLALAAGKLPKAAEVRAGVAPGDEQLSAAKDERGGDLDNTRLAAGHGMLVFTARRFRWNFHRSIANKL